MPRSCYIVYVYRVYVYQVWCW